MTTVMKLDKHTKEKIAKLLSRPLNQMTEFFTIFGGQIQRDTSLVFRTSGARRGHPNWKPYRKSTIKTKSGTWKIKRGTDGTPKPLSAKRLSSLRSNWIKTKGWGGTGEMRKGVRRHNGQNLLQASRLFKKSFGQPNGVFIVTSKNLLFGTNHKLAEDIMSNPTRQVLFVTDQDLEFYNRMWVNWYKKRLVI